MEPLVSIYCATYNHSQYICNALDGFIGQKTNFPFEVIVHDDCSTDGTQQIVSDYASRYPEIIKPVLQKKNRYSEGHNIFLEYVLPVMRGKYIARCEGDDYWCNTHKLQQQVDFLEKNPQFSAATHNTTCLFAESGRKALIGPRHDLREIPFWKLTSEKPGFHTSSIMHKKSIYDKELPAFMHATPGIGDYPLRIFLGLLGPVYYSHKVMSVYRSMVPGSFSQRNSSLEKRLQHRANLEKMLIMANEWSDGKEKVAFADALVEMQCARFDVLGEWSKILKSPYSAVALRRYGLKSYARIALCSLFKEKR